MNKSRNGRVLERLLEPVSSSLNEEAARKLIGLKADRKAQARVDELARKCNEGQLTPEERQRTKPTSLPVSSLPSSRPRPGSCWPAAGNLYESLDPGAGSRACPATLRVLPSPGERFALVLLPHRTHPPEKARTA